MQIDDTARAIHENAKQHGWWDGDRQLPEILCLCHSELSEALEEYRNYKPMCYMEGNKPEGIAIEMADCIIRILDWFAHEGISAEKMIKVKMDYNRYRPYRHGNKKV